jgi:hypothetical protein
MSASEGSVSDDEPTILLSRGGITPTAYSRRGGPLGVEDITLQRLYFSKRLCKLLLFMWTVVRPAFQSISKYLYIPS